MSRIVAVTQRVDVNSAYGERRDALDRRWSSLLAGLGLVTVPVPNEPATLAAWLEHVEPPGVILSGGNGVDPGPDHVPERNAVESTLIDWARRRGLPLVGVCRGMQMLNVALGGALSAVEGHVAVRHSVTGGEATREVNSYHAFGIRPADLACSLEATAFAPDGTVEACRHRELPWRAVMWHPEREIALDLQDRALFDAFHGTRP